MTYKFCPASWKSTSRCRCAYGDEYPYECRPRRDAQGNLPTEHDGHCYYLEGAQVKVVEKRILPDAEIQRHILYLRIAEMVIVKEEVALEDRSIVMERIFNKLLEADRKGQLANARESYLYETGKNELVTYWRQFKDIISRVVKFHARDAIDPDTGEIIDLDELTADPNADIPGEDTKADKLERDRVKAKKWLKALEAIAGFRDVILPLGRERLAEKRKPLTRRERDRERQTLSRWTRKVTGKTTVKRKRKLHIKRSACSAVWSIKRTCPFYDVTFDVCLELAIVEWRACKYWYAVVPLPFLHIPLKDLHNETTTVGKAIFVFVNEPELTPSKYGHGHELAYVRLKIGHGGVYFYHVDFSKDSTLCKNGHLFCAKCYPSEYTKTCPICYEVETKHNQLQARPVNNKKGR